MEEMKVKKREWVKNAAIIFLAVMLVLTFFSNTIMNRSLPEVATANVTSGEIVSKVRGTGPVTANQSYEVTLSSSRQVEAVRVKQGDEVKKGQVLFTLSAAKSDSLTSAEEAVDNAQNSYQQAIIEATKTSKDAAVIRAREALQDAKTQFAVSTKVTANDVAAAKKNYDSLNSVTIALEGEKVRAETALENAGGWTPPSGNGDYSSVQSAMTALSNAQTDLSAAKIRYQDAYKEIEKIATEDNKTNGFGVEANMRALAQKYKDSETAVAGTKYKEKDLSEAYTKISTAQIAVNEAQSNYNKASSDYSASISNPTSGNYQLKQAADKAKVAYQSAKVQSDSAQARYDSLKQGKTDYDTAKQDVYAKEDALSEAMANIKLSSLNINNLGKAVSRAQQNLANLSKDAKETEIKSTVDGIMKSVDAVAGKTYDGGATIATIELPEQGYIVSFSVTTEQSRKVHTGDEATITNYFDGNAKATLQAIKPDPQNPQTNKILVFNIVGDVAQGTSLTISVGERSAQYDAIVPNSAIRSDSNGDFVLAVVSKSSPLGNRYIATRVDVQKVATDDTNTAVSGALSASDYVITTSSKPVSNKDHVKLADS